MYKSLKQIIVYLIKNIDKNHVSHFHNPFCEFFCFLLDFLYWFLMQSFYLNKKILTCLFSGLAEISQQFSQQLDRLKSDDSTASNLTIVELPDPSEDDCFTTDPTKDVHENSEFIENVIVDDGTVIEESIKRAEEMAMKRENDDKMLMQDLPKKKFVKRESVKSLSGDLNNHINNKPLSSCLSRRGSSRSSIKKKVVYNESAEVIPEPEYFMNNDALHRNVHHDDDDDEVFSDNIPPPLPRGDMCTPFVARRGSIPGLPALPDWFPDDKWFVY